MNVKGSGHPALTKVCPACDASFVVSYKRRGQRYCDHKCAFAVIGHLARAKAYLPEVRNKLADKMRGGGAGKSYIKRDGRHEHRTIAEKKIGRALVPGEIVHHDDDNKRNNDPENLMVLPNQAAHARLHGFGRKKDKQL
jgi:hypothetical protein